MTYTEHNLRNIHDWDHPVRPIIDAIELIVLLPSALVSFFYAISGNGMWIDEEGELRGPPIWELFTSWRAFSHLVIGSVICLASVLLIRDWYYGLEERREEQRRCKAWKEEVEEIRRERDGN